MNRDRILLRKVGRYYLRYWGVVNLEDLLRLFRSGGSSNVDNSTLSYVREYLLFLATEEAVRSARRAKRERSTFKEFAVEYSQRNYGPVDVARTLITLPYGLKAYFNYREGYDAPEYSLLGYLLRRIYSLVKAKSNLVNPRSSLRAAREDSLSNPNLDFTRDFRKTFNSLSKLKDEFPKGKFRRPVYTDPGWLRTAFRAFSVTRKVEKVEVSTDLGDRTLLRFVLWKLYELYVFYLIVAYLQARGYKVLKSEGGGGRGRSYVAVKDGEEILMSFNVPLGNSRLKRVDSLEGLNEYRGRPDLALRGRKTFLFESKYSWRHSYITAGRFKVMAYALEYRPDLSILVYPGLKGGRTYDEEEEVTANLHREVERNGYLCFDYEGQEIYMVILDPGRDDSVNLGIIQDVLGPRLS
jgi:hypothetical protein